jgi:flavodoxin
MPKTLVTYFSLTGNTKKVAEEIYDEIQGEKVLKPISEVKDPDAYRNLFVGFPVHSHTVPYSVEVFLKKIPEGRSVALFSTHGSLSGSFLAREALEYASVLLAKARVVGTFSCRGRVSMKALEILKKSPEHQAWTDMAASAETHPDENDLADARAFARWSMTLFAEKEFGWA